MAGRKKKNKTNKENYKWGTGERAKWNSLPKEQKTGFLEGYKRFAQSFRDKATADTWKAGRRTRYGDVIIEEWKKLSTSEKGTWTRDGNLEKDQNGDGQPVDGGDDWPIGDDPQPTEGGHPVSSDAGHPAPGNGAQHSSGGAQPDDGAGNVQSGNKAKDNIPDEQNFAEPKESVPEALPPIVISPPADEGKGYDPDVVAEDIGDAQQPERQQALGHHGTWKFLKVLYHRQIHEAVASWNYLYVALDETESARDRIVIKDIEFNSWIVAQDKFERAIGRSLGALDRYQRLPVTESIIPEPFIWLVIRNIAAAIFVLEHGKSPSDEGQLPDHIPIVHLDIKTPNIFLDEPLEPYLAYPNPKLADFDTNLELTAEGRANNRFWGTPSFMSPEQEVCDVTQLSSASDIFCLGLVIASLTRASLGNRHLTTLRGEQMLRTRTEPVDISRENTTEIYSSKLLDLEDRCLRLVPEHRPTARELWEQSNDMLRKLEASVTGPFRKFEHPHHLWLCKHPDAVPLGRKYEFKKRKADEDSSGDDAREGAPAKK
ncbi:kinase-like protein [Amniculicola lignicola CBS 123094]|uniref:non-specific serine/threonine protein kinase n=1 Tax=Amniculicola lignicola CBS 123094 TaxID=1392246 RepID=A0A6A5WK96_9PLEO|nr:kinase-like protein [Amniculicola lignicola CBS 123094]